jgi:glycosyltransferase involved in cell wall biosynthesis
VTDPRVRAADVLIGLDYDGYGLKSGRRPPLLASIHAIYRDVLQWETGAIQTMVQAQAFFDQVAMERADHITIGSEYGKSRIVELYGIEPEKITVIPHGMPQPTWLPLVDSEPRVENDHPILLFVGKMYPRKRIDILLRALPHIREVFPDVELRIIGDGIEWDRLQNLATELDVRANMTFLSHIADDSDFAKEWRQADVLCHPSLQETFGFIYLEGMMLGKPIVAARAGAAPEVLGDAALLVEPESPVALADGIVRMLQDDVLRARVGQAGMERARSYSHSRMIDGYVEAINRITS